MSELPPHARSADTWRLTWCDIFRDGGSYGATLSNGDDHWALWLDVLPWDHPRDQRWGALFVSAGDVPERMERVLGIGSEEEQLWLRRLSTSDQSGVDEEGRIQCREMVGILAARRGSAG